MNLDKNGQIENDSNVRLTSTPKKKVQKKRTKIKKNLKRRFLLLDQFSRKQN